jgi:hypothetical protein
MIEPAIVTGPIVPPEETTPEMIAAPPTTSPPIVTKPTFATTDAAAPVARPADHRAADGEAHDIAGGGHDSRAEPGAGDHVAADLHDAHAAVAGDRAVGFALAADHRTTHGHIADPAAAEAGKYIARAHKAGAADDIAADPDVADGVIGKDRAAPGRRAAAERTADGDVADTARGADDVARALRSAALEFAADLHRPDVALRADRAAQHRRPADERAADGDAADLRIRIHGRRDDDARLFHIPRDGERAKAAEEIAGERAARLLRHELIAPHRADGERLHRAIRRRRIAGIDLSEIAGDDDVPEIVIGRIDRADVREPIATRDLHDAHREIRIVEAAAAQIDEQELVARAFCHRGEVRVVEGAGGDLDGHEVAIEVGVSGRGGIHDEHRGSDAGFEGFEGGGVFQGSARREAARLRWLCGPVRSHRARRHRVGKCRRKRALWRVDLV